jgi:hypothetical protein
MLRGYAGRPWWSADQYARLEVVHVWDDLRLALRDGDRGRAAAHARWLVRRPRRLAALARMWRWRLGGRRRSGRTDRAGRPTLALLPGASGAPPADRSGVVDLRDGSLRSALARLARRPTAAAVPGAPVHRPLLRAIGVRAVRPPSPSAQDGTGATT